MNRDEDPLGEDWFLVESDLTGAELLMMAIASQDATMIDHCLRNQLKEDHPDFFDLHSNTTVNAFKFKCEPTKAGLMSIGKAHLRAVGKAIAFGVAYGRGAKAIAVSLRQEGTYVTVEECQETIKAFFTLYPDLAKYLNDCKRRVTKPGWLADMFGCYRRFSHSANESNIRAYEREAMNSPIQGGVARAMSLAVRNMLDYRKKHKMRFQIVLQIHDAVVLHVPASELAIVTNKDNGMLKKCMRDYVPLRPRDLDGRPLPGADEYHFGSSIEVYGNWGQPALVDRFLRNSCDPSLGHWKRRVMGLWAHPDIKAKSTRRVRRPHSS